MELTGVSGWVRKGVSVVALSVERAAQIIPSFTAGRIPQMCYCYYRASSLVLTSILIPFSTLHILMLEMCPNHFSFLSPSPRLNISPLQSIYLSIPPFSATAQASTQVTAPCPHHPIFPTFATFHHVKEKMSRRFSPFSSSPWGVSLSLPILCPIRSPA